MKAVRFTGVSKRFALSHEKRRSVLGSLAGLLGVRNREIEEFWALRDISFEVDRGKTLGIIGPNGSGKSTILKLLTGTLLPDEGTIETNGNVFGLLELGAGFHPDLTGRENVFLNGSFLGIGRHEMARLYDWIVEFSELQRFIDTPVKHYSSGMYMRLGFAIAIAVRPEVMVIDEVLAVGDAAFARKCYEALAEVKKSGRTMLFVSHDPIQVRRFCDTVLWIDQGRVHSFGSTRDIVQAYLQATLAPTSTDPASAASEGDLGGGGPLEISDVYVPGAASHRSHSIIPGESFTLRIEYASNAYLDDVAFGCSIRRSDGLYIHDASSAVSHGPISVQPGRGTVECSLGPISLGPGIYHVSVAAWPIDQQGSPYHLLRSPITIFVGKATVHQRGMTFIPSVWRFRANTVQAASFSGNGETAQPDMLTSGTVVRWSRPPGEIRMGESEEEHLGKGWHPVESWPPSIRWIGDRASLSLTQDVGQGTLVISACRPFHSDNPASGSIKIDGEQVTRFQLVGMDFEDVVVPLEPVIEPTTIEVELEIQETFVPAAVGIDPDTRKLGLAVRSVRVE